MQLSRLQSLIGLLMWVAIAATTWILAAPLGHDEAQYALAAIDVLEGDRPQLLYLSQGTIAIAMPGIIAGASEVALRFLPLLLGIAFVLASAYLAREITTRTTAAWLVAVLAASLGIVKHGSELLGDMPAAACLLAGATLLVTELTRDDGPRRRIILVGAAFAAALYIRYGSAPPIAIISIVAAIGGGRGVVKRPLYIVATLALFAVLLLPHLLISNHLTGSPLGILLQSGQTSADLHTAGVRTGVGLADYFTSNPFLWYGFVTTPVLVVGIASIIRLRDRKLVMVWAMAIANIIAIGLTTLAQPRYIYFSIVILAILGIDQLRLAFGKRLAVAAAVLVGASWVLTFVITINTIRTRRTYLDGVAAIHEDAAGRDCRVETSSGQVQWYTRCKHTLNTMPHELHLRPHYIVITPSRYAANRATLEGNQVVLLERRGLTVLRIDPQR